MATCYLPSGDVSDTMQPCGEESDEGRHCCFEGHYCLSSLLCLVPGDLSTYRGGCTLEDWDDDVCSNFCKEYSGSHSGVHRCIDETDGTGQQLYACLPESCGTGSDMFAIGDSEIVRNEQLSSAVDLQASATRTVEVTAATTTGSCASTADASPGSEQPLSEGGNQSCESDGVSTGAAVGIGLGASLPLLAVIAVVTWLLWRERTRVKHLKENGYQPGMSAAPPGYKPVPFFPGELAAEVHPSMSELPHDDSSRTAELDASSPTTRR